MLHPKNKIIFAETNASVGNGHHVSNIENIPVAMKKEGVPFAMVTETNVRGKNFIPFFTPIKEIEDTGNSKGIVLRRADYQKFIEAFSQNICFVLSNYAKDMEAWIDVLSDKKYQEIIKKNNTLLIIHVVVLYPLFFEHKTTIKKILRDLKGYVFFSFFTSEIAEVAKKIYGCNGFLGMIHPVYDSVYNYVNTANVTKKYDFTFWLGGGENLEHHVVEFLRKIKKSRENFKAAVRISPIRDYNYLLLNYLNANADIEIYTEGMTNSKCIELFSKSKIGIMPYDVFEGSVKASAVFENFILCGVPVLVPKKTWMYEVLKELGSPGLGFDAEGVDDFNSKLLFLEKNYESFAKKAKQASAKLYERISFHSFMEKLLELNDKRSLSDFNFYGNKINNARVLEGYSYFRSLYFDSLNDSKLLFKVEKDIKHDVAKYSRLRFCLIKKNIYNERFLNSFFANIGKYSPSAVAKVIGVLDPDILKDKKYKQYLIEFINNNYYYFSVSALNKVAEYGLVSGKVKNYFKKIDFLENVPANMQVLLADFLSVLGIEQKALVLRKSLVAKMVKIKRKTLLEHYTLASIYIKLGFFDKAKIIYKKILRDKRSEINLKGGSCFHLGCIFLREENNLEALSYFCKTLRFIPLHGKAREYIKKLK